MVRQQGNLAILPVNQGAVPIFQARISLKWDISRILSAIVWVQYINDNNATFVEQDPTEGTVVAAHLPQPELLRRRDQRPGSLLIRAVIPGNARERSPGALDSPDAATHNGRVGVRKKIGESSRDSL